MRDAFLWVSDQNVGLHPSVVLNESIVCVIRFFNDAIQTVHFQCFVDLRNLLSRVTVLLFINGVTDNPILICLRITDICSSLVHVSRVFHLFLISSIFVITKTRACRHALENILPIYLILVYHVSIVKL